MYSEVAGGEQGGGGDSWLGRGLLCSCPTQPCVWCWGFAYARWASLLLMCPDLFISFIFEMTSLNFQANLELLILLPWPPEELGLQAYTARPSCTGASALDLQGNHAGCCSFTPWAQIRHHQHRDVDNPCSPDIEPMCYSCSGQNLLKTLELTSEELKLGIQGGQLRGLEEERRNRLEPHWLPAEHCQIGRFPRQSCQDWALQPEEQPSPRLWP